MNKLLVSSFTLVTVALVGCSLPPSKKKADSEAVGTTTTTSASLKGGASCNHEKSGRCTEFKKDDPLGLLETGCKDIQKATFTKDTGCASANLMGTCERQDAKEFYYFGGAIPWVQDAKTSCEKDGLTPGKFTASPNAEQTAKDKAVPTPDHIVASCTEKDGTLCEDLYGDLVELQTSSCEQGGRKLAKTPCASEKLVGSCVKEGTTERHYEPELKWMKLADLQKNCESSSILYGHWYPNADFKEATPAAAPAKKGKKKSKKPAVDG